MSLGQTIEELRTVRMEIDGLIPRLKEADQLLEELASKGLEEIAEMADKIATNLSIARRESEAIAVE